MAHIKLTNAGLTFHSPRHGRTTLKEYLVHGLFTRPGKDQIVVQCLKNIDLEIREGERLGVIGHNGAGKSSLLRLLAGIYPPTEGMRQVQGQISSLFEISLGFEPEATGWENIMYRGYLQGETPRSIREKMQEIGDFCELGEFLDMPVRHYSSGMAVRLAFAIATAVEPEILLVDEVLSVGDLAFQAKAKGRMKSMMAKARLIVMVSHDLEVLAEVCERAVWLDHGEIRQEGNAADVVASYRKSVEIGPALAA